MEDKERLIQRLQQLLQCQEHERLEIERHAVRLFSDLLGTGPNGAYDEFERALAAYRNGAFERWQRGLEDVRRSLAGG